MGPRPWRPAAELNAALDRGDLHYATTLAEELRIEQGKPIRLDTAARFLPLFAPESPREYDSWALRWLARWASEIPTATAEQPRSRHRSRTFQASRRRWTPSALRRGLA